MAEKKKSNYTLEIVFGGLVLVILLAIFVPSILGGSDSDESSPSVDGPKEGIEVPVEEHDPVLGDEDAPVTVVEFVDYQCPSCKVSAEQTLPKIKEKYVESGEVRYVLKDFPLSSHPNAVPAAVAVRAAGEQGMYWEMHDLVFENQSEWAELSDDELNRKFLSYAEELGLDTEQFAEDIEKDQLTDRVMAGRKLGEDLGVRYTPTMFVNGKVYEDPVGPDELEDIIEEAKRTADSLK